MATVEESRLLSDLGEISAALKVDLRGITPTKAFHDALDQVKTRCEDAITTLRDAHAL
jgi:hypothetical protein